MNRRDFLKTSVVSSTILGLEDAGAELLKPKGSKSKKPQTSIINRRNRRGLPSCCALCYAACGIIGYVEYGRLNKIGGNPNDPNSRGRICAKGQAGINYLYDPERILYPLKRNGERGSGKWRQITWEEAYTEISRRLQEVKESGHPEQFVFLASRRGNGVIQQQLVKRFLNAFGTSSYYYYDSIVGPNKSMGLQLTWGENLEINDLAHTKYILNFGSNPYESHYLQAGLVQRLVDARINNNAKLVTFDVRLSQTASKSDEWFPVFPGTDSLVALAMANTIMEMGLYDESFLTEWTNYSLEGLKHHLAPYTPEWAEQISGVPHKDIRRIAREYATAKPATTISGGGISDHRNGVYNERAVALLNIITGNIDIKGGYCLPRQYHFVDPDPLPPEPPPMSELDFPLLSHPLPDNFISRVESGKQLVKVLMTYKDNIVYAYPNPALTMEVLTDTKLVPFFVVIDSFMSETAALADIVLPGTTYLEQWDLSSPPALDLVPFVVLTQPVVAPQGQTVSFIEICTELAYRIGDGMEKYFTFGSALDYLEAVAAKIPNLVQQGGMSFLQEHGVWRDPNLSPQYRIYQNRGFRTPSKKIEIYSKRMKEKGYNPLPIYEANNNHKDLKKNQLILTTFQWHVHTDYFTANCLLLAEIVHHNPIWINPETARSLGIEKGDLIRVTTRHGSLIYRAYFTQGIHPKVVAISDNCGHWEYGRVAQAKKFRSNNPDTSLIWWEREGNGIHPGRIISIELDPIGGGQAWMDTVVTVS
jgi:anaerobic selenocysteine-containing dehydrogenase